MVRSFRFTATLTAMQLATSLVRVVLALGEAAQTATRQLDAEAKKKGKVRRHPTLCADFHVRHLEPVCSCWFHVYSETKSPAWTWFCHHACLLQRCPVARFCMSCRQVTDMMPVLNVKLSAGHVAGEQGALRGAAENGQPQPEPDEQPEGDHPGAVPGPLFHA